MRQKGEGTRPKQQKSTGFPIPRETFPSLHLQPKSVPERRQKNQQPTKENSELPRTQSKEYSEKFTQTKTRHSTEIRADFGKRASFEVRTVLAFSQYYPESSVNCLQTSECLHH